jgi:hypothetical protein
LHRKRTTEVALFVVSIVGSSQVACGLGKPSAHSLDCTRLKRLAYIRVGVRRQASSIIEAVAVDASRQLSGSHLRSQMPASMVMLAQSVGD